MQIWLIKHEIDTYRSRCCGQWWGKSLSWEKRFVGNKVSQIVDTTFVFCLLKNSSFNSLKIQMESNMAIGIKKYL